MSALAQTLECGDPTWVPRKSAESNQAADPLAEPTPAMRVIAAMKVRRITKSKLMQLTGIAWSTIHAWSQGRYQPDRERLEMVAPHLGYGWEELMLGRRPVKPDAARLTMEERTDVLDELDASPDERRAWGEHEASPAGRHQRVTRAYVVAFVEAYRTAIAKGIGREEAIDAGWHAAVSATAAATAKAEGRTRLEPPDGRDDG